MIHVVLFLHNYHSARVLVAQDLCMCQDSCLLTMELLETPSLCAEETSFPSRLGLAVEPPQTDDDSCSVHTMVTAWTNLENKIRIMREGSCLHETVQTHLLRNRDIGVVNKSEGNGTLAGRIF
jgi:hypothetical protein